MNDNLGKAATDTCTGPDCAGIPLWKRGLDLFWILMAAPMLLPLGVFIALAIKILSPGPIFFKQTRIGYLGREFQIWKFRTMTANASINVHQSHLSTLIHSDRPMTKLDAADPRVIRGGALMRSLGIDELPQLINVLRGEMSLVGPRPCLPYEYQEYQPHHKKRFNTLPGLTGLWQVSGKNRTTFEEMISLDLCYVREKSLWLDLKIMLKTLPAISGQVHDAKRAKSAISTPFPAETKTRPAHDTIPDRPRAAHY